MKTRQKNEQRKMGQPKDTDVGSSKDGDEGEEEDAPETEETIRLLQWLEFHQSEIESTADILKDEVNTITMRKIKRNLAILKNEKRPETARLAKSIVTGFYDSIFKAIKNLQALGLTMTSELRERFNLVDDWMETRTVTSIAGSDVVGPTFSRKELENRKRVMDFLEGSRSSDTSDVSKNTKLVEMDNKKANEKADETKNSCDDPDLRSEQAEECSNTSKTSVNEESTGGNNDDKTCNEKDEEEEITISNHQDDTTLAIVEDIINDLDPVDSTINADVDMIPPSDDESSNASNVTVPHVTNSPKKLAADIGQSESNKEDENTKEATQDATLPDKNPTVFQKSEDVHEGNSDSDDSGKTRIVPLRSNQAAKLKNPGGIRVKMEPVADTSKNSRKTESPSPRKDSSSTTTTPVKIERKSEVTNKKSPEDKRVSEQVKDNDSTVASTDNLADSRNAKPSEEPENYDDDLSQSLLNMEELTAPVENTTPIEDSREEMEIEEENIENRASSLPVENNDLSLDEPEKPDVTPGSSTRVIREKDKLSKEEADAMRDVLDTSSSSEAETPKKKSRERKTKEKQAEETLESDTNGPCNNEDSKSWKDDPKLKDGAAEVRLERLSTKIEKALVNQRYVDLKGYSKMKKCRLDVLESGDFSDTDSTASDDSLAALKKELKKLSRSSILDTRKYRKRTGQGSKAKPRRKSRKNKSQDENSLSDATESESEISHSARGPPKMLNNGIESCSGSEDLEPESDEKSEDRKVRKKTQESRKQEGNKKKYVSATISSSSDTEKEDKEFVLGSDSDNDSESNKKRSKKRAKNTSDSDSDFVSTRSRKDKVKKQKKKGSDSDDSIISINNSDSDSDFKKSKSKKRRRDSSSEPKKRKKKARRRILNNGSDDSDKKESSDSDIEEIPQNDEEDEASSSQKGRKKIRKIMSTKALAKTTREAEREEEERRKRLSEKQKLFNGIHNAVESDKIERLVLDVDPETKEAVIEVDASIVKHLKPHQADGIKFMYNACFESVNMIKEGKVPGGCILAHCMGLGKTLQSVAFVHSLLLHEVCGIKRALVICPLSTVNNWYGEFRSWTEDADDIRIHKLFEAKNTMSSRIDYLKIWERRGGVGIIHYDLFRRLVDPKKKAKKMSEKYRKAIQETLLEGPDVVICDEGHLLKNWKSMLSMSVNSLATRRRIVLTGTPLQNNLVEYHTMMNFVKPNLLGSLPEFTNRFVNPIKNGQHADSTEYDVKIMKRRAHVLHRKLEGCVQRCDYSILSPYLPPKYEYIIHIKLSEKQESLYKYYLENIVDGDLTIRKRQLLKYYAELVKVWSHPIALTMRRATKDEDSETEEESDSLKDFIVDESSETSENESGEGTSDTHKKTNRKTRAQAAKDPDPLNLNGDVTEIERLSKKWWNPIFKTKSEMEDVSLSGKLVVLQQILKTCESIGDKVLVFSQFLSSLDIIEEFINDWDKDAEKQQKDKDGLTFPLSEEPVLGRWRRNIEYFRIDGQTKVSDRHRDCEKFNRKSAMSRAKLFLISTRAGGLGINLYGANRVVIFDASWNPSQDMQSIFRVYRFGQDKPCYIYRLIARGTMEEKILRRQITKLSLSSRVVDEHQIERHFKFDDINEMYRYDVEDTSSKEPLAVPKDRLLADLLISHEDWIRNYEEFDSLLENKTDEGLSKEEKELAWEEYKLESERQRQFNTTANNNNEATETFLKVRERVVARNPNALESQIREATQTSVQVIDKIRSLMLQQNQSPPDQKARFDGYVGPLKTWLQNALAPPPPGFIPPPFTPGDLLPPLPFSIGPIRPPTVRRQPAPAPPPPNVVNNFQNIAASVYAPQIRPQAWRPILQQQLTRQPIPNYPPYPRPMQQPFSRDPLS